jgi:hypothetical protein
MSGSKRRPSVVSTLIEERRAVVGKRRELQQAAQAALERHDPLTAHPELAGELLNPWKPGCADCERERALHTENGELWERKRALSDEFAAAAESAHAKRLAGQRKTAANRHANPNSPSERVRQYCEQNNLALFDVDSLLLHRRLGMSRQSAQRALRKLKR